MTRRAPMHARTELPAVVEPAEPRAFIVIGGDERLDVLIARELPDCSRAAAQRLIGEGRVTVAGRLVTKPSARVAAGAEVSVTVPAPRPSTLVPEAMPLEIVYEDADLLVVNKPSGMVVHPAAGHDAHTLVHGLLARRDGLSSIGGEQRPGIVHRLDRDTSGLMMVAKNDRAHAFLSRQLQAHRVDKFYLALLRGAPKPPGGIVDAPIGRDPRDRKRMAIREGGRPSRSRYQSVAWLGEYTLVVAGLETGRTHQLRVHFAALGCPIGGDPLYGAAGGPAGRLWLHAWRLAFNRPSDGLRVTLEAPLPPPLADSLRALHDAGEDGVARALAQARRWAAEGERGSLAATEHGTSQHKEGER